MKILALILFMVMPVAAVSQNELTLSGETRPVTVRGGNVINAMYALDRSGVESGKYINMIIYTRSYREALRPFDDEAVFFVDGLSKVFKVKNWTARCVSDQIISSIIIRLDKGEFESISYAGTVGLKIGMNTFELPYEVRHYMRQVIVQMKENPAQKMVFYNPGSKDQPINRIVKDKKSKIVQKEKRYE